MSRKGKSLERGAGKGHAMVGTNHIILTSHKRPGANRIAPLVWGAATAKARGGIFRCA